MSERDGFAPGVPCWVQARQDDPAAAARFYAGLLGWETEETARGHFLCRLRGRDVAAIGPGTGAAWTTYVWVASTEDATVAVRDAGGTVVAEPFDGPGGGRMAVIADPAGAELGLLAPGSHRGAQLVNEPGAYAMSLLQTADPAGAEAFYGAVFGWETEPFGGATMWRLPGYVGGEPQQPVPRDVVAVMVDAEQPAAVWGVNFWVADIDAAVERADALGGSVVMPPVDSPVGRDAVIADPGGAVVSISQVVVPGA